MSDFLSQEEINALIRADKKQETIMSIDYSLQLLKDQLKSCKQKKDNAMKLISEDYDYKINDLQNAISILEDKTITKDYFLY